MDRIGPDETCFDKNGHSFTGISIGLNKFGQGWKEFNQTEQDWTSMDKI